MPIGEIIGAGASIVGGMLGGGRQRRWDSKAKQAFRDAIARMQADLKTGRGESKEFFEQALGELNAVGPAMRQELLARGKEDIAGQEASALGTGLTGTTAMSGQLRGSRADTQRTLTQLEESLAGARSSMYSQRGAQVYQEYIDKANVDQRTGYDPFYGGGMGTLSSNVDWGAFGGAVEDIFSWFSGMGGGGGATSPPEAGYSDPYRADRSKEA